ncbi:hypothetical protein K435DRAFT_789276 [Dendrothele bispora CBS 962.96]|uniref:Zn(2)-C6 fungal-type domain-containing protein n=1 Tax=Dendrothele bispora (strain CBS 962.96) TaxID=1314807 RepID=A0A4S8MVT5_DENBC|nr:hypothetical protein K435DRAFT_789276 [Dendrothele bispora CBS 962.96]
MSPSTTPSRASKGKAPAPALRASPTPEPPAPEANKRRGRLLDRLAAPGPRPTEPEEVQAPPNASRMDRLQVMRGNTERLNAFIEAEAAWEERNQAYEKALAELEERMAEWVEEWKEEFQKDRDERKEKEEGEGGRREKGRGGEAEDCEAGGVRAAPGAAAGCRLVRDPAPSVVIERKRKGAPDSQSKICERCQDHKIPCRPQQKGRTLACQGCREAKARCSLTEPARKRVKSAPEVQDEEDASYALNLFAGELATRVQEMDKKIDENRTTAFRQSRWTDSEDEGEEEDGKGGPDGFFDFEAIEIDEEQVRKEEERAGAGSDEEDDDEEEEGDNK